MSFFTFGTGKLVRAVEVKQVGESNVCKFSLGSNHPVKKGGKTVYEPTFLDVEYWVKNTEFVEGMEKGKPYEVAGQLVQEHWEKDGEKRSKFVLKANSVQSILPKGDSSSKTEDVPSSPQDDVPF